MNILENVGKQMKRPFTIFAVFSLIMAIACLAPAAYIDIRPNGPIAVDPGDPFSVGVWLVGEEGDDAINLSYKFDIGFDPDELQLKSIDPISAVEALPNESFTNIKDLSFNADTNTVDWFDGYSFGSESLAEPIYYGSIDFTVLTPVDDGLDDVWVVYITGAGITIDSVIEHPSSVGPSVITNEQGNINGDSSVDLKDAILALQVLVQMQPTCEVCRGADVNGDGKIGMEEVIYVVQKISGMR